jgi:hypothetical protein
MLNEENNCGESPASESFTNSHVPKCTLKSRIQGLELMDKGAGYQMLAF